MYNGPFVSVTDRPFVNFVHYQYDAIFLLSLLELKFGLLFSFFIIINTKETFTSTLRLLNNCLFAYVNK